MHERWIWPFELQEKIGQGAMGVVYRARTVTNNRVVALKLLPSEFAADEMLTARFEREMEVLKTLKHPHIVNCFGGVCEGKQRFYAMELVEGGSLFSLIQKRGRLSWLETVEYMSQICSGLACAHEHGVVHRDVKPANFLLTKSGKLKLSDFGLAHVGAATKLTAAGKTMGTYHYMAPEQIRGSNKIGPQTDLYAAGCVFFEMLAGRPPFEGETPAEILHQHLNDAHPKLSELVPDCPHPVLADMIVDRLLEKDVKKRPKNAKMVADWVKGSTSSTTVSTPPTERPVRKKKVSVAATKKKLAKHFETKQNRLLAGGGLLLVALLVWNLVLMTSSNGPPVEIRSLTRSDELWIEAFQTSKQPAVRMAAANALSEIALVKPDAIQPLIEGLSDTSPGVREATVLALAKLGPKAKHAISPLVKMQNDDNANVRRAAAEALTKIRKAEAEPSS